MSVSVTLYLILIS